MRAGLASQNFNGTRQTLPRVCGHVSRNYRRQASILGTATGSIRILSYNRQRLVSILSAMLLKHSLSDNSVSTRFGTVIST